MKILRVSAFLASGMLVLGGFLFGIDRAGIADVPHPLRLYREFANKTELPDAQTYVPSLRVPVTQENAAEQKYEPEAESPPETLPAEINLAVPFTSQAPHQNWDLPWQEFCEEASVLMAGHYFLSKDIPNADYADAELHRIKAFEEERLGYWQDTTAEETALVLREFYHIQNVSVEPVNIERMKQALAQGKLVLVPAAGRQLGNPYFTQPGPLYHMLVIKGYTKDGRLITNDPGTRRGKDYVYDPNVILNAAHDWNNGDVEHGEKLMIVAG